MNNKIPTLQQNQKSCIPTLKANAFAAHLILPNRTQSPPTARQVGNGQFDDNF